MQEWRAAQIIETAVGALREIRDGEPEPRTIAAVALMEVNDNSDTSHHKQNDKDS